MRKKIDVKNLQVGMHLHELCGPWMDHPFWRSRFPLTQPEEIRSILESGISEAWIDVSIGLDVSQPPKAPEKNVSAVLMEAEIAELGQVSTPASKPVSMSDELARATIICARSKQALVSMFQEVRMGQAISAEAAGELVDEISSSVLRNPGALISLAASRLLTTTLTCTPLRCAH